jgi:hypothetical protein
MRLLRTTQQSQPGFPATDSNHSAEPVRVGRCLQWTLPVPVGLGSAARPPAGAGASDRGSCASAARGAVPVAVPCHALPRAPQGRFRHRGSSAANIAADDPRSRQSGITTGALPCFAVAGRVLPLSFPAHPTPANPRRPDRLERARRRAPNSGGSLSGKYKCPRRRWRWPKRARGGGPAGSEPASWKSGPPPR